MRHEFCLWGNRNRLVDGERAASRTADVKTDAPHEFFGSRGRRDGTRDNGAQTTPGN